MQIQHKRTKAVWEYILDYATLNGGAAPSVRDFIRDNVDGITSTSIVDHHLNKLENMGLIKRYHGDKTVARTIEIVGGLYVIPKNVRENKEPFEYDETIFPTSKMDLIQRIEDRKLLEKDLGEVVIATDDQSVKLIAIAFGMPTISRNYREWEVEEEDSKLSV